MGELVKFSLNKRLQSYTIIVIDSVEISDDIECFFVGIIDENHIFSYESLLLGLNFIARLALLVIEPSQLSKVLSKLTVELSKDDS